VTGWSVTATFAEAVVGSAVYPRSRRMADAAVRGALLLDLAASRLVLAHDGALHANTVQCGFAPADVLLALIADETDLWRLVWRAQVGMEDVITEFVARRWWEVVPRRPWHLRTRYQPTNLLTTGAQESVAAEMAALIMALFSASTDIDGLEAEAANTDYGTATWLVSPVLHELVEMRSWLQAAVSTSSGGG
jgi:hypothetical protein